eukprot:3045610-Rhodomonas_salina.1
MATAGRGSAPAEHTRDPRRRRSRRSGGGTSRTRSSSSSAWPRALPRNKVLKCGASLCFFSLECFVCEAECFCHGCVSPHPHRARDHRSISTFCTPSESYLRQPEHPLDAPMMMITCLLLVYEHLAVPHPP